MRLRHKSFPGAKRKLPTPFCESGLNGVKAVATPGSRSPAATPFTAEQLPEVIGSLLAMSHINRFSHG